MSCGYSRYFNHSCRRLPLALVQNAMGDMGVDHKSYTIKRMISAKTISRRVASLAKEISDHFSDTDKLVVVGLLRGSFVFIADLVRQLAVPVEVDFLEASSYGDAMESSREVRIVKDISGEIEGRDLLLVEDIIDTGHTMAQVLTLLQSRNPKCIEVCTLLDKPARRELDVPARWVGFEIPDWFVVGYGIDYAQRNRNLPYIGKVEENTEKKREKSVKNR